MRLPHQAAPVQRRELLEPAFDLKDGTMIGADPGDPSPFNCNSHDVDGNRLRPYIVPRGSGDSGNWAG